MSPVVGRSVPKVDAPGKVKGSSRYVDDLVLPGMLYARLARATEAHAEVVAVGAEAAMELPETVAVLSSANLAEARSATSATETAFGIVQSRDEGTPSCRSDVTMSSDTQMTAFAERPIQWR